LDLQEEEGNVGRFALQATNVTGEGSMLATVPQGACADYAGNLAKEASYVVIRGTCMKKKYLEIG
jgi:hypothetical protein